MKPKIGPQTSAIFSIYDYHRFVIADGRDQLTRGYRRCKWAEHVPPSQRQIVTLHRSLRLKAGVCHFVNVVAEHGGLHDWIVEPFGIPPDKFGTIFEEFRQADEGSSRSYQGTGLGLPICKRLIEMHNGRIWLESQVGVGSTFFFSLPLVEEAAIEAIASPSDDTVAAAPHDRPDTPILVIDNDPATIEIIRTYLQPDGYVVHSINDSRLVLDEARRIAPAAIILDIMIPHKDGWEVLTELKTAPDLRDIPVICYTIVDNASLGISLGANAYLVKPIEANVLRETVSRIVQYTWLCADYR